MLLLAGSRDWQYLDEKPFRDIYELINPQLPHADTAFQEGACPDKIDVPLRLAPGSHNDAAGLWVIRKDAMEQMEALIKNSDELLLSHLRFAVADAGQGKDPLVVIRTRSTSARQAPPVLVLDATQYRSYLRLPNLFVPVAHRVHPPLRQDAIAKLLASDPDMVTWLHPLENDEFRPESIADRAFRPMSDWIEYVLDHQHETIQTWIHSHQFFFGEFTCNEDTVREKKPPKDDRSKKKKEDAERSTPKQKKRRPRKAEREEGEEKAPEMEYTFEFPESPVEESLAQQQLQEAEAEFVGSDDPLDSQWRREAWANLGNLNAALKNQLDTTVCWSNSLWDELHPSPEATQQWLAAEIQNASDVLPSSSPDIDDLLAAAAARPHCASLVAAYLVHTVATGETDDVRSRLNDISQFLHQHEGFLPIRTTWLAWYAIFELSDRDTLALARARDRILERLFNSGLTPELNLPTFLRAQGAGESERYRAMLEQVSLLQETVEKWITEPRQHEETARTKQYAKLTFAFAMARLGENSECQRILATVANEMKSVAKDPVHKWVSAAYQVRAEQILRGEKHQSLPEELIDELESMAKMEKFKVDRLRSLSRIIEPHERVNAFTRWHQDHADPLMAELAMLSSITDSGELRTKLTALISKHSEDKAKRLIVLPKALELSPRMGEAFAKDLLNSALHWLEDSDDIVKKAQLLQRSLYIAAHFGRMDALQALVNAFNNSLPDIVSEYFKMQVRNESDDKDNILTIEDLFTESFRDLRKMGMRDEIGSLYGQLAKEVADGRTRVGKTLNSKDAKLKFEARALRLLLCAASGWYYFGQEFEAREVADAVRGKLFANDLPPIEQRGLSCAYISAVAQAPETEALQRIEELYGLRGKKTRKLDNIHDNFTTSSHFSISQLDLIEESVLALVSEDFSLSAESRRWLDEDEYLVRKRIHEDVHREF